MKNNMKEKKKCILIILITIIFASLFIANRKREVKNYSFRKTVFVVFNNDISYINDTVHMIINNEQKTNASSVVQAGEDNDMQTDGDDAMQVYAGYSQFPFESMSYITDDVYKDLKQMYADINFRSEFKKGDTDAYNLYKEKYLQLLHNEIKFYDAEKNKNYYLAYYDEIKTYNDGIINININLDKYIYLSDCRQSPRHPPRIFTLKELKSQCFSGL